MQTHPTRFLPSCSLQDPGGAGEPRREGPGQVLRLLLGRPPFVEVLSVGERIISGRRRVEDLPLLPRDPPPQTSQPRAGSGPGRPAGWRGRIVVPFIARNTGEPSGGAPEAAAP